MHVRYVIQEISYILVNVFFRFIEKFDSTWEEILQTDKASMLDEVIEHLKQLQAQVQMMNTMRNISSSPQVTMMPIGMTPQQQLQMSLLSRMSGAGFFGYGLGLGMGVVDINSMARVPAQPRALPPLLHPAASAAMAFASTPQLMVPPVHTLSSAQASSDAGNSASFQLPDPHRALLTQVSDPMFTE